MIIYTKMTYYYHMITLPHGKYSHPPVESWYILQFGIYKPTWSHMLAAVTSYVMENPW